MSTNQEFSSLLGNTSNVQEYQVNRLEYGPVTMTMKYRAVFLVTGIIIIISTMIIIAVIMIYIFIM